MLLACFACFMNQKKDDTDAVKHERIKYLPFVWRISKKHNTEKMRNK
jgi:hypothetical protein